MQTCPERATPRRERRRRFAAQSAETDPRRPWRRVLQAEWPVHRYRRRAPGIPMTGESRLSMAATAANTTQEDLMFDGPAGRRSIATRDTRLADRKSVV